MSNLGVVRIICPVTHRKRSFFCIFCDGNQEKQLTLSMSSSCSTRCYNSFSHDKVFSWKLTVISRLPQLCIEKLKTLSKADHLQGYSRAFPVARCISLPCNMTGLFDLIDRSAVIGQKFYFGFGRPWHTLNKSISVLNERNVYRPYS